MSTVYNLQYNIPRVQVQLPGRQNRLSDGAFRISPTMTEPVIFQFGNQDGVALNLVPFSLQFVVWENCRPESNAISMGQSNVVLNKRVLVNDPYANAVEMILTEEETTRIGNHAPGADLVWSLFLVNEEGEIFPMQVSHNGNRFGSLHVDLAAGLPVAELIRTPTS